MAVDPSTIQAVTQLSLLGLRLVDRFQQGSLTEEEFERELQRMRTRIDEANRRWKLAAQTTGGDAT